MGKEKKIEVMHKYKFFWKIREDLKNFIINLIIYNTLLSQQKILEDLEYENEMVKNLQFLMILKEEFQLTPIIKPVTTQQIEDIRKSCVKTKVIIAHAFVMPAGEWMDEDLHKLKLHEFYKNNKYSNQNAKTELINNTLKTKNERKEYKSWKTDYNSIINGTRTINTLEQEEEFKNEVNSFDLQIQPSTNQRLNDLTL